MATKTVRTQAKAIVTLADLAPRQEVMGGSQRRVFGAATDDAADSKVGPGGAKKLKDLAPKSGAVKGGKLAANDALTLVRTAKPIIKKDLPPRQDVKGGRIAANDALTLVRAAKPTVKKDLPPRQDVKGGKKAV